MSGPKVVRIVTREEFIAIAKASLRRLDKEVRRWERSVDGDEASGREALEATRQRRDALYAELAAENFDELSKRIAGELAYLRQDRDERIEHAAAHVATERRRQRRLATVAGELLAGIDDRTGIDAPSTLRDSLQAAQRGQSNAETAQQAINEALILLTGSAGLPGSNAADAAASQRQRELARRLAGDASLTTLATWLSGRDDESSADPVQRATRRGEQALALFELEAVSAHDATAVLAFTERVARLADEPSARRCAQLADSLVLELAAATHRRRQLNTLIAEAEALVADLADLEGQTPQGAATSSLAAEVAAIAADNPDTAAIDALETLSQKLRQQIGGRRHQAAADARRRLVLDGMAKLGYQVNEGMQTAWAEHGRIVVGKTGGGDYGVELGGGTAADRLQLRTVAFAADPQRATTGSSTGTDDKVAETAWCNEVEQLKAIAAAAGGELTVERARAVGEVPVKVVGAKPTHSRHQRERERRESRMRRQQRD
jgi:hypothetical protein